MYFRQPWRGSGIPADCSREIAKIYCLPSLSRRLRIEWLAIPVTNCLLLTGTPLVPSNVGAPWTRLVRGRHELDGDPVIADNGSGQVRPRWATIQMTTNERRNEDLWQHDRILRLRNGERNGSRPKTIRQGRQTVGAEGRKHLIRARSHYPRRGGHPAFVRAAS